MSNDSYTTQCPVCGHWMLAIKDGKALGCLACGYGVKPKDKKK